MPPQRYTAVSGNQHIIPLTNLTSTQVNAHDDDDVDSPITPPGTQHTPSSPPPSFRSRDSSPSSRRLLAQDPLSNGADQDLADTFDDGSDAENEVDDRQRLMRAEPTTPSTIETTTPANPQQPRVERRITELPAFRPQPRSSQAPANDGVFANLAAKLDRGEQLDEKPPVCPHPSLIPNPY
jgi:hypothetical protein